MITSMIINETRFIYGVDNTPIAAVIASYNSQTMIGNISLYPVLYDNKGISYLTPEGICLSYISYEVSNAKLKEILNDTIAELNVSRDINTYTINVSYNEYINNIDLTYSADKDSCYIYITDNEGNVVDTPTKYSIILSDHYIVMYKQSDLK